MLEIDAPRLGSVCPPPPSNSLSPCLCLSPYCVLLLCTNCIWASRTRSRSDHLSIDLVLEGAALIATHIKRYPRRHRSNGKMDRCFQMDKSKFRCGGYTIFTLTRHRAGSSRGDAPDLYTGDTRFKSRPGHRLSCLRFPVVFLSPSK
jgi:hypothetical protein